MADEFFLSRWSRLKREARESPAAQPRPEEARAPAVPPAAAAPGAPAPNPVAGPEPLPPVESLTTDSDFTPFMRKDVDPNLRQQALRTLFSDPRFNVMDGLDVYIDDYSKPDPLPVEWLARLNQVARLGEYREPDPQAAGGGAGALATAAPEASQTPGSSMESDTSEARVPAPEWGDRGVHSTAKETHEFRSLAGADQPEERTRDTRGADVGSNDAGSRG